MFVYEEDWKVDEFARGAILLQKYPVELGFGEEPVEIYVKCDESIGEYTMDVGSVSDLFRCIEMCKSDASIHLNSFLISLTDDLNPMSILVLDFYNHNPRYFPTYG